MANLHDMARRATVSRVLNKPDKVAPDARIGFLCGRARVSTNRERQRGYAEALASRGIPFRSSLMRTGDLKQESGRMLANGLLALRRPPTALFVVNNLMAVGAPAAAHQRGLSVPDGVAVVGFDDLPWANALNPPLTVVRQPAYEIGRQAMELLLRRIAAPSRQPLAVRPAPKLVVRSST